MTLIDTKGLVKILNYLVVKNAEEKRREHKEFQIIEIKEVFNSYFGIEKYITVLGKINRMPGLDGVIR